MKNFFINHPQKNGMTYFEHFRFSFSTGLQLAVSSVFFVIHSIFTFIPIPKPFNCKGIVDSLDECASRTEYGARK